MRKYTVHFCTELCKIQRILVIHTHIKARQTAITLAIPSIDSSHKLLHIGLGHVGDLTDPLEHNGAIIQRIV